MVINLWRDFLAPRLKQSFRRNCLERKPFSEMWSNDLGPAPRSYKTSRIKGWQRGNRRPLCGLPLPGGLSYCGRKAWNNRDCLFPLIRTTSLSPSPPPTAIEPSPVVKADAIVKCVCVVVVGEIKRIFYNSQVIWTVSIKYWQFLTVQPNTMCRYKTPPPSHKSEIWAKP